MKKGKDWALSCVAVSAAVLVGMSTTVQADTTNNANSENTTSTKTGNTATTQATNSDSAVTQAANDEVQDGGLVTFALRFHFPHYGWLEFEQCNNMAHNYQHGVQPFLVDKSPRSHDVVHT